LAVKSLQTCRASWTRLAFNVAVQQIPDFWAQFVFRNRIVLDVVAANGLCGNLVCRNGSIQN
jgi:hypothetical protein